MDPNTQNRSVLDLFTQLVDNMSFLFRKEIELAKAEMSEKAGQVGAGAAKAAIGGVLMIPALVVLLWSAVAWLETVDVPVRWGTLIVGIVVAVIGFVLLKTGMNAASTANLKPRRTTTQLQRDVAVVKEQVR
jgi:xanthine/uracil permease